jgi:glycosyltransferase involved in cell wall biosynthesis
MHLCVVAHNILSGDGQGRINYEIVHHALKQGHKVTIVADSIDRKLTDQGATLIEVRPRLRQPNLLKVWRFADMANAIVRKMRQSVDAVVGNGFVLTEPHDLNLCQFVHGAWINSAVHVSKLRKGPYSWYQWLYSRANTNWEQKAFAAAKVVVAPSHRIVGDLTRIGVGRDKISVIFNGVDTEAFKPGKQDRESLGIWDTGPVALFAGDIRTPRKNLDTVLKALVNVPQLKLAVVGALPRSPFPALAAKLNVQDRVRFLGYRRDVDAIMRACDFFVFPSRYEAGSLVILEAMSCGLPVISAVSAGGSELIGTDAGTVLQDSEDVAGLAAAMSKLCDDSEFRSAQSVAARKCAEEHNWSMMASEYLNLLEGRAA